jgi:hypothetical protein
MRMRCMACAALLLTMVGQAHATTLWYTTTNATVSGGFGSTTRGVGGVTFTASTTTGVTIDLALDVPSNVSVTGIELCYSTPTPQSAFIYHVELYQNDAPADTLLRVDTQLSAAQRTCTSIPITPRAPSAPFATRLSIVLSGGSTSMTLAAVGLDVQPASVGVAPVNRTEFLQLHQSVPNPTSVGALIEYETVAKDPVRLEIYDVAGRLVRTFDGSTPQPGTHQVLWDARDDAGREVPAGIYLYRVVTPRTTSDSRRLTIVR